jgi:hypothetical protein
MFHMSAADTEHGGGSFYILVTVAISVTDQTRADFGWSKGPCHDGANAEDWMFGKAMVVSRVQVQQHCQ